MQTSHPLPLPACASLGRVERPTENASIPVKAIVATVSKLSGDSSRIGALARIPTGRDFARDLATHVAGLGAYVPYDPKLAGFRRLAEGPRGLWPHQPRDRV